MCNFPGLQQGASFSYFGLVRFLPVAFDKRLRIGSNKQLAAEECASSVEVSIIRLNASMLMVREHNIPCSCWPFSRWWEWDRVGMLSLFVWTHQLPGNGLIFLWNLDGNGFHVLDSSREAVTKTLAIKSKRNRNLSCSWVFRELTFKLGNFQQSHFSSFPSSYFSEGSQEKKTRTSIHPSSILVILLEGEPSNNLTATVP